MVNPRLHLAARQGDPSPRFRCLLAGCGIPGVALKVDASWVGACAVSFLLGGIRYLDVLPSVDEAQLVAGLLSSPMLEASDIRVLGSESVEGGYNSVIEWGRVRLGNAVLRDLLSWWHCKEYS